MSAPAGASSGADGDGGARTATEADGDGDGDSDGKHRGMDGDGGGKHADGDGSTRADGDEKRADGGERHADDGGKRGANGGGKHADNGAETGADGGGKRADDGRGTRADGGGGADGRGTHADGGGGVRATVAALGAVLHGRRAAYWGLTALWVLVRAGTLALGLVFQRLFDQLGGGSGGDRLLWSLIAWVAAVEAARLCLQFGLMAARLEPALQYDTTGRMRRALLASALRRPGATSRTAPGEALRTVGEDVDETGFFAAWSPTNLAHWIFVLASVTIMIRIDPTVTLALLALLIAVTAATGALHGRFLAHRRATRTASASVAGALREAIGSVAAVQAAAAERHVSAHVVRLNEARARAAVREELYASLQRTVLGNAAPIGVGLVLLLTATGSREGSFTVGDLALFTLYLQLLTEALASIGILSVRFQRVSVALERVGGFFGGRLRHRLDPPAAPAAPARADAAGALRELTVRGLTARHPGGGHGVEDIDLTVVRHSVTVITGGIGSGKTTLLRAVLGLLPRERQNTGRPAPAPELDRVVAAARAGDWRPGADLLAATGEEWERRTAVIGELAGAARRNDVWLQRWRSERPEDPGAAAVQATAMIDLAWEIRAGARGGRMSPEQSEGFFRILSRAGQDITRAKELDERDPSPYVADIWRGIGLNRPHQEMHRLWGSTVALDPYHLSAHRSALQYWSARWHGSRDLAFSFAERAGLAAPPGLLLSSLWLLAWWDHRPADADGRAFREREVMAAVDRLHEDASAADPGHPHLAEIRHVLAYFLVRQGRAAPALEQFRRIDGHVGAFPWTESPDPVAEYCAFRDLAINLSHAR
ncbi:ABC transporter transmembrane domain-containing protein [Streptomyces clavuligerus]|uniref:ABC transporter transmembrane domain-containing protein n=2 Tax=Streptomyces clavuligerus TaxID=1901 RepID=UPI00280B8B53|nr:ABC transporter transmembrane domain-containing protein [Streptomyces clavuligerus]